ncbi:MAG TPA: MtrB/PioB family outer membrane beta-barrel protein, partial [Bacteroidota bacterium]
MNTKHLLSSLVALSFVLFGAARLSAQFVTNAQAELGGRQFNGTLGSSKFTEYRDLPGGLFVNMFFLDFMNAERTSLLSFRGVNVGQQDQNFALEFGSRGMFMVELEWDQVPHNYTNTGRTVFSNPGSNELVMPDLLQNRLRTILTTDLNPGVAGVQFDTSGVTSLVLGSARPVDILSRRDKGKATVKYSPTEELDIRLQYSNERRSGTKPLGGNFFFNPIEVLEPTDYRTHVAKAGVEYARRGWSVQFGYSASIFDNNVDVLVWDNPFREIDAIGGPSRGRIDLYPSNTAHNVNVSGGANLPLSTRLAITASYGWRRQDDQFIPFTINTALDTLSTFPSLPGSSLNGKVNTSLVNLSLTNRFFSSVWLTARYRVFDYDNQT